MLVLIYISCNMCSLLVTKPNPSPGSLLCTKRSCQISLSPEHHDRLDIILAKAADAFQASKDLEQNDNPPSGEERVLFRGEIPGPENTSTTASSSDVPLAAGEAPDIPLTATENKGRESSTAEKLQTVMQR